MGSASGHDGSKSVEVERGSGIEIRESIGASSEHQGDREKAALVRGDRLARGLSERGCRPFEVTGHGGYVAPNDRARGRVENSDGR